ncbi:DNA damage-binding protein 1 isoform X2 [Tanacetum coccineum]
MFLQLLIGQQLYASSNKKLLYSNMNLKEVNYMCRFNSAAFPDSLAIAKEGELTIGTIDDIQKLHIRSIPLGEHARRICHQEQSRTFAICSLKYKQSSTEDSEMHFIRLLDDDFISSYSLDQFEYGCSILSCSFSDDNNAYYCVGTAYVMPEENEPTKGRILIFMVEDGKLQLVVEKENKAFNGKLLAAINQKIQLYKWMLRDDGRRELQSECGHHGHILALYVQTRGDFIHEEVCKNSEGGATDEERGRLEVVGEYLLGEFVNRFRHGITLESVDENA